MAARTRLEPEPRRDWSTKAGAEALANSSAAIGATTAFPTLRSGPNSCAADMSRSWRSNPAWGPAAAYRL